jgi:long-subunit acyl-CoA synthetase (AMP-forming)
MFMLGYVHMPMRKKPGWFRTGDVGRRDAHSSELVFLGRADSRINLPNGHDVYPEEIELALRPVLPAGYALVVSLVHTSLVGVSPFLIIVLLLPQCYALSAK